MKEANLTKEQEALFDFFFDYSFEFGWDVPDLYYYRSGSSLHSIFEKDSIILRLTLAEYFDDKLEGKAVEVYYDIALENLLADGRITQEQYEDLIEIELPKRRLIIHRTETEENHAKWEEYDTYVICFSSKKDDPYMYDRYVHNKATGGFCVEFSGIEIKSLSHDSMKNESIIKLIRVLYGKQAVSYIQEQIISIIQNPFLYKNRTQVLGEVLTQVQFSAKRSRYYRENEIRLVVFLAKDDHKKHPTLYKDDTGKNLYLRIPKHMVFDVSADPSNDPSMTEEVIQFIEDQGYRMM